MKSLDDCGIKLNVLQSVRLALVMTFSLTLLSCTKLQSENIEWETIKRRGTSVSFDLPQPVKSSPNKYYYTAHEGYSAFSVTIYDIDPLKTDSGNSDSQSREDLKASLEDLAEESMKIWKENDQSASEYTVIPDGYFILDHAVGKQYLIKMNKIFPPGGEIVARYYVTPESLYLFQVSSNDSSNPEVTHFLDSIEM